MGKRRRKSICVCVCARVRVCVWGWEGRKNITLFFHRERSFESILHLKWLFSPGVNSTSFKAMILNIMHHSMLLKDFKKEQIIVQIWRVYLLSRAISRESHYFFKKDTWTQEIGLDLQHRGRTIGKYNFFEENANYKVWHKLHEFVDRRNMMSFGMMICDKNWEEDK